MGRDMKKLILFVAVVFTALFCFFSAGAPEEKGDVSNSHAQAGLESFRRLEGQELGWDSELPERRNLPDRQEELEDFRQYERQELDRRNREMLEEGILDERFRSNEGLLAMELDDSNEKKSDPFSWRNSVLLGLFSVLTVINGSIILYADKTDLTDSSLAGFAFNTVLSACGACYFAHQKYEEKKALNETGDQSASCKKVFKN